MLPGASQQKLRDQLEVILASQSLLDFGAAESNFKGSLDFISRSLRTQHSRIHTLPSALFAVWCPFLDGKFRFQVGSLVCKLWHEALRSRNVVKALELPSHNGISKIGFVPHHQLNGNDMISYGDLACVQEVTHRSFRKDGHRSLYVYRLGTLEHRLM